MSDESKTYRILFLCTDNATRSLMAECATRRYGMGRFAPYSAGVQPAEQVHPLTVELLRRLNYPTDDLQPKSYTVFAESPAPLDFIVTVAPGLANRDWPAWPGNPAHTHWPADDPIAFDGTEDKQLQYFKRVYLELENRIKIFCSLRIDSLDRLTLENRLSIIGTTRLAEGAEAAV